MQKGRARLDVLQRPVLDLVFLVSYMPLARSFFSLPKAALTSPLVGVELL